MTDIPPVSDSLDPGPRPASTAASVLVLAGIALLALPLFAWIGYQRSGPIGIQAALVAAGVCWAGAAIALWLAARSAGGPQAISGILLGMFFRFGGPLLVGVLLHRQGGLLAKAGVFGMILAYYLLLLVPETLLAVRCQSKSRSQSDVTGLS